MKSATIPNSIFNLTQQYLLDIDQVTSKINLIVHNINNEFYDSILSEPASKKGQYLCLHPYQYHIGYKSILSAHTAIKIGCDAILRAEISRQTNGVALIVTASDASHFANKVSQIARFIAHPAWIQLSRLATKKTMQNIERMQIPKRDINPVWIDDNLEYMNPIFETNSVIESSISCVVNDELTPAQRIVQLARHQVSYLQKKKNELADLKNLFSGNCYALKLTGPKNAMHKQLSEMQTDNQPYSSLLILLSEDDQMNLLYEALGL